MRRTLSTDKAKELARAQGLEGLEKSIVEAEGKGWNTITLVAVETKPGEYDITAEAPTGVMVAWFLPTWDAEQVAVAGGEPADDLHVTLCYLGDVEDLTLDQQGTLVRTVMDVAGRHYKMHGYIKGTGRFQNGEETDPFWVGIDIPGMKALREDLATSLEQAGIRLAGFHADGGQWQPHITVAYLPAGKDTPPLTFNPLSTYVSTITVAVGPTRFHIELAEKEPEPYTPPGWAPSLLVKNADGVKVEERYTVAPWYIPDQLDAHGEWSDAAEVEKTFNAYMDGDRIINTQHAKETIKSGEVKHGIIWPVPVTLPMQKADGTSTEYTFPAGTPFLGIKWEPWAWEGIKTGMFKGLSIGGTARRIEADIPTPNEG